MAGCSSRHSTANACSSPPRAATSTAGKPGPTISHPRPCRTIRGRQEPPDRRSCGGERPGGPLHRLAPPGGRPAVLQPLAQLPVDPDQLPQQPPQAVAQPSPVESVRHAICCSHARAQAAGCVARVRPGVAACGGPVGSAASSGTQSAASRSPAQGQLPWREASRGCSRSPDLQHEISHHGGPGDRHQQEQCSHEYLRPPTRPRRSDLHAVGYGTVREDKTGGPQSLFFDGVRRYALQHALNLEQAWLLLSMNPSTGNGGTCYGDSGAPISWVRWTATWSCRSPSPVTPGVGPPTRPTGWTLQRPGTFWMPSSPSPEPAQTFTERCQPREGDQVSSVARADLVLHSPHPGRQRR
jgi:hypothetical protein